MNTHARYLSNIASFAPLVTRTSVIGTILIPFSFHNFSAMGSLSSGIPLAG
jgi:hypothetical protein